MMRLRKDKKNERQKVAKMNAEKRQTLSNEDQLIVLDRYGYAAVRERKRLLRAIEESDKTA
jgi:hypothetical protein